MVINKFSIFSQLYSFQLHTKIPIGSYFDSFFNEKDLIIFGLILENSAIVVRCSAQFSVVVPWLLYCRAGGLSTKIGKLSDCCTHWLKGLLIWLVLFFWKKNIFQVSEASKISDFCQKQIYSNPTKNQNKTISTAWKKKSCWIHRSLKAQK